MAKKKVKLFRAIPLPSSLEWDRFFKKLGETPSQKKYRKGGKN